MRSRRFGSVNPLSLMLFMIRSWNMNESVDKKGAQESPVLGSRTSSSLFFSGDIHGCATQLQSGEELWDKRHNILFCNGVTVVRCNKWSTDPVLQQTEQ